MKSRIITTGALSTLVMMFALFHSTAHAYIDPGSGSIILQAVVGGIFALLLAIKAFWGRITAFFSPSKKGSAEDNEQ